MENVSVLGEDVLVQVRQMFLVKIYKIKVSSNVKKFHGNEEETSF